MIQNIPFQTRARTVDHLGREQIADCPTAITELWKNAYDAYARNVELHVFDGDVPVAAVVDDGHGMNKEEFLGKWLVIGTDSKASNASIPEKDMDGLPGRVKQGQKGIGRLSSGIMGSLLLLISKRNNCDFVAALIDWRLFENPYLLLSDINIPVVEFSDKEKVLDYIADMFESLCDNVWPKNEDTERGKRLLAAWNAYSLLEQEQGKEKTTSEKIAELIINAAFSEKHFKQWRVWNGLSAKGTALFVADINDELMSLLEHHYVEDDIAKARRNHIYRTLSCFYDPFVHERNNDQFNYSVFSWHSAQCHEILSRDKEFNLSNFYDLEHYVDGAFDETGVFRGKVKAFGENIGAVEILPPSNNYISSRSKIGPFKLCIGTFEGNISDTTLTQEQHSRFEEQAKKYSGLNVHRDNLRVLPYGRPDSDFFEIDDRRSRHLGREFWVHRQIFGRVAISREANPLLKDKAGREGLIDNTARQIMKILVINFLRTVAKSYFGTDSNLRNGKILAIQEKNKEKQKEESKKAKSSNRKLFAKTLRENKIVLDQKINELGEIENSAVEGIKAQSVESVKICQSRIVDLADAKNSLSISFKPAKLGPYEDDFHSFNDDFQSFSSRLENLNKQVIEFIEKHDDIPPENVLLSTSQRHAKALHDQISKWGNELGSLINVEKAKILLRVEEDSQKFQAETVNLVAAFEKNSMTLSEAIDEMDNVRDDLFAEFREFYEPYIRALKALAEGVELDTAASYNSDENERLQEDLEKFTSLAQLGITVELVAHELDRLEHTTQRHLQQLPKEVQNTEAYKTALDSHRELMERIRFLSPLKLSGAKYSRSVLTGKMIFNYVNDFFKERLNVSDVNFHATDSFDKLAIEEYRARIYPVFINLVNNAIYWVCQKNDGKPEIMLDFVDGKVFVSDNGPGVSPADQESLFKIFFTRRIQGRGVGLYLCKTNLALGRHEIHYGIDNEKRLAGANFVIEFKGVCNE